MLSSGAGGLLFRDGLKNCPLILAVPATSLTRPSEVRELEVGVSESWAKPWGGSPWQRCPSREPVSPASDGEQQFWILPSSLALLGSCSDERPCGGLLMVIMTLTAQGETLAQAFSKLVFREPGVQARAEVSVDAGVGGRATIQLSNSRWPASL